VEALRIYIGGDGRGDGDPAFKPFLQEAYVASNVDEFRRPLKLRERLIETEGPVFTLTLRLALVKLFDGLPSSHYTVLPHLDDDYVAMITLARATSEREPPMTLGQWHNFVARYFALGIALKRAICDFDHEEDNQLRMEGGTPFVPELTPEHEALLSQQAQKRVDAEDTEFEKQMNYFAENDASEYDKHEDEMRQRAGARLKRGAETKWEMRRRHALLRRDERREQAERPSTVAK